MDETPTATAAALALDLSGRTHIVYSENPVLYATNASGSWSAEPLEPQAGACSPSLAVSNDGVVHVAFRRDSTIWYLHKQGGAWTAESVDEGDAPSLAVDSTGSAHLSFATQFGVYHTANPSGEWVTEAVLANHRVGDDEIDIETFYYSYYGPTSLAVDADDEPHILCPGTVSTSNAIWSADTLYHAARVGDRWTSYDLGSMGNYRNLSSFNDYSTNDIIADPKGRLHATWGVGQPGDSGSGVDSELDYSSAFHTWGNAIRWRDYSTIDDGGAGRTGIGSAVGVDALGNVHISFYTEGASDGGERPDCALRYASDVDGSWVTETIDTDCTVPGQGRDTLAVDPDGAVHVVYHTRHGALKYARHGYTGDDSNTFDASLPSTPERSRVCSDPLEFSSQQLYEAVRSAVGDPDRELLSSDVARLSRLEVDGASSLEGIQCLTGLATLDFQGAPGLDLAPLADLTDLAVLDLAGNQIVDVSPLASLTNLIKLGLTNNEIVDVSPLASLRRLTSLNLADNQIVDVTPLASLSRLTWLFLGFNQITDVAPLASLTRLNWLNLQDNEIVDISPLLPLENLELSLVSNPLDCETQKPYLDELVSHGVNGGVSRLCENAP